MYTIRYEGGVMQDEQGAVESCVPAKLNKVVKAGLTVGNTLIERWFGKDAIPGKSEYAAFDEKRKRMSEYLNSKCTVMSFVKKTYGARVDSAEVEEGDYAQVMRSCFKDDGSGFVPSGIRIYMLGTGFIKLDDKEQFNTIAHEISHRVIGTVDTVYGRGKAQKLAKKGGGKAVGCAENWGYFYQEVMERLA